MNFSTTSKISICAVSLVASAVIGWKTASQSGTQEMETLGQERQTARDPAQGRSNPAVRESVLRMKAIREMESPVERLRGSISLAMSLPASEFAAWAEGDRFDYRAGPELSIFRMILFERWEKENPESLIEFTVRNNHGQAYRGVESLLKNEPEVVLDYFREHPNDNFELHKLATIAKKNPSLALDRLAEMSVRGMTPEAGKNADDLFRELAKSSPEILEAALEGLSPLLQREAETALAGQRLSNSFQDEIRNLWSRPDGWELFSRILEKNRKLGANLADEITNMPDAWRNSLVNNAYYMMDNGGAKRWLSLDLEAAGFTAPQAERMRKTAIQHFAYADPKAAMQMLNSVNLEAYERSSILSNALSKFGNSPEKMDELIELLSSEEDKEAARRSREFLSLRRDGNTTAPSEWIKVLGGQNIGGTDSYYFTRASGQWNEEQVGEFRETFETLPENDKGKIAAALASRAGDTVGNDSVVGDAIRYLVQNPQEQTEGQIQSHVDRTRASEFAVRLASNDLAQASEWINTLPQGEAKTWAQRNVARDLNQYDPSAVRDWIKTLPQGQRNDLNGYLAGEE